MLHRNGRYTRRNVWDGRTSGVSVSLIVPIFLSDSYFMSLDGAPRAGGGRYLDVLVQVLA